MRSPPDPQPNPFLTDLPPALLARLAATLPPDALATLGRALGRLRRELSPNEVQAVRGNLRWVMRTGSAPPPAGEAAAPIPSAEMPPPSAPFQAFGLFVAEFLRGLALSPAALRAGWQVSGSEHLTRLVRRERGFILAGAHTGNWEHLGALGPWLGRRIVAPVGVQFHPWLSATVKRLKGRHGVVSVPAQGNPRQLLRALERGDLVALPLDGGAYHQGVPVVIGATHTRLPAGPARLALLSGCPIVPVFSRRVGFLRQRVTILPPHWPPGRPGRAPGSAVQQLTGALGEQLAAHLRRCPGQWCIFRPWPGSQTPGAACGTPQPSPTRGGRRESLPAPGAWR